jgi:hypothetical protein
MTLSSSNPSSWRGCHESGTGKSQLRIRGPTISLTYDRINAAIKTQLAAGGLKGALLKKAVDAKLHNWRTTGQVTHRVYDALVFRKVRIY